MVVDRESPFPFSTLATQKVLCDLVRHLRFPPAGMRATEYQESPGDICTICLTFASETFSFDIGDGFTDYPRFGTSVCTGLSRVLDPDSEVFIVTLTIQGKGFFPTA